MFASIWGERRFEALRDPSLQRSIDAIAVARPASPPYDFASLRITALAAQSRVGRGLGTLSV
ncbi:MAG TPA: hypothetical protein VJB57_07995 [Dehalococcoidia bacterium]|nr:hypothetical protein [Dehalococcoidia bacterium]